jgi:hypothetical protein
MLFTITPINIVNIRIRASDWSTQPTNHGATRADAIRTKPDVTSYTG